MLTGENIILRGLELADTDEIMKHFNDVELRRFLGLLTPVAKEEEDQWIRNTWENRQKGIEYVFGIELKDNPEYYFEYQDEINMSPDYVHIYNNPYFDVYLRY